MCGKPREKVDIEILYVRRPAVLFSPAAALEV